MKRTSQRPQRVTMTQLERLAFVNPGTAIEVDEDAGIAVLTLTNPKREYVARLDDEPVRSK